MSAARPELGSCKRGAARLGRCGLCLLRGSQRGRTGAGCASCAGRSAAGPAWAAPLARVAARRDRRGLRLLRGSQRGGSAQADPAEFRRVSGISAVLLCAAFSEIFAKSGGNYRLLHGSRRYYSGWAGFVKILPDRFAGFRQLGRISEGED